MALGDTYTGDAGAIQGNIDTLTKQLTSQIQGAPQVKTAMGESLAATEGAIPILSNQRGDLISELFKTDQQFAEKYGNASSPTFVENPVAREQGIQAAQSSMWGGISGLGTQISSRQQLLGDAIDRGMALYNAGIQAKQVELDTLQKNLDRAEAKASREADISYRQQKDKEDQRRWEAQMMLEQQKLTMGGAEIPQAAKEKLSKLMEAQAAVDELERIALVEGGSKGAMGVVYEPLAMIAGSSMFPEIQALRRSQLKYALPLQALTSGQTSGSSGTKLLNEMKKILPQATDHPDEARKAISQLRQAIASNAESLYTVYGVKPPFNPYAYEGVSPPAYASSNYNIPGPTQTASDFPYDQSRFEEVAP